jgi:hypothetical protein
LAPPTDLLDKFVGGAQAKGKDSIKTTGNNISVEERAADHGEHPRCQACGEQIQGGEDFYFGSDGCRCEKCSNALLKEGDTWAVDHCLIVEPEACCREGLSDEERFRQTNFYELIAQFPLQTVRDWVHRSLIEDRMVELIEVLLQESDSQPPRRSWRDEGF